VKKRTSDYWRDILSDKEYYVARQRRAWRGRVLGGQGDHGQVHRALKKKMGREPADQHELQTVLSKHPRKSRG